jgi:hypothetical protein
VADFHLLSFASLSWRYPIRVISGPSASLPGTAVFEDKAAVGAWKRLFAGGRAGNRL